jgi:HlyD family secretion protein
MLSSAPWVMAIRNGRAIRLPIHLGLQGATQIEILDGLTEGDVVIPATSVTVAGQRVRPSQS